MEGLHIARIEPGDMPDHEAHAALLNRRHDVAGGCARMGERLFEKDRLAGLGRGNRRFLMKPIRQADADGVEFGQRQQRAQIIEALRAGFAGDERGPPGITVADGDQLHGPVISIDAGMAAAEETQPNDADPQDFVHFGGSGMGQPRKSSTKVASSPTTASKNSLPASGVAREG
jgi:hypothetical protein